MKGQAECDWKLVLYDQIMFKRIAIESYIIIYVPILPHFFGPLHIGDEIPVELRSMSKSSKQPLEVDKYQ